MTLPATSNPATNPAEQALSDGMAKLETALLTPVVSGELNSWVKNAQQAADNFGSQLGQYIDRVLHKEFNEIAKSDSELLERVQSMYKEEKALVAEHVKFREDLASLVTRSDGEKRDELKMAEQVDRVEKRGHELILSVKRLQVAASTWLTEAVYRDRGPVD